MQAKRWVAHNKYFQIGTKVKVQVDVERLKFPKGEVVKYNRVTKMYTIKFPSPVGASANKLIDHAQVKRAEPYSVLQHFKDADVRRRKAKKTEESPKESAWFKVCKILALLQPSSAAAERVFAMLSALFPETGRRGSARFDLVNTSVKMRTHGRRA